MSHTLSLGLIGTGIGCPGAGRGAFWGAQVYLFKREHSSMTCPLERKGEARNNIIPAGRAHI